MWRNKNKKMSYYFWICSCITIIYLVGKKILRTLKSQQNHLGNIGIVLKQYGSIIYIQCLDLQTLFYIKWWKRNISTLKLRFQLSFHRKEYLHLKDCMRKVTSVYWVPCSLIFLFFCIIRRTLESLTTLKGKIG